MSIYSSLPVVYAATATSTGTTAAAWVSPVPALDPNKHYLKIVNHAEDYGQDDYHEELEWEIIHHPDCPQEIHRDEHNIHDPNAKIEVYSLYSCAVGNEVMHNGLDSFQASDLDGDLEWRSMEPGEYEIEAWSSGPDINGEYDGGLRLVN